MARTRRRNKISKIEMRGEIGFKIEPRDNEIITITNALQITVPISGDRVPNKIQVNTVYESYLKIVIRDRRTSLIY